MSESFEGRHVVVSGGTGALGSAVVAELIERGAICHIPARSQSSAKRLRLADHPDVRVTTGVDLTDEEATTRFYAQLDQLWASIQVAGGFAMSPIAETTLIEYTSLFRMNVRTCFLCCREAVKKMRATTATQGGRLVNVAGRPALQPSAGAGMAAYASSKAAVAAFSQALAEELAGERIYVNAVVPSILDTAPNRSAMPDADHDRWPDVTQVARVIVDLASPQNDVVRGALIPAYGRG